ncbi:MAG: bifunctional phosphoribosylaminoimidazolecarboxamide formyltransferase/IMP cyclohydrolase [Alphaproteobacteria bacterium]
MANLQKIKRCLISVSDKSGIVEMAKFLESQSVEIISTGGTYQLLKNNNIKVKDISQFTNFPEIMDGRLKTLHPRVHGGLLTIMDNQQHLSQATENNIEQIDLLIVNLYPFVETVAKTNDQAEIIENIDIGGPAMVRSCAKNFAFKTVISDVLDYEILKAELNQNNFATSLAFRKKMASRAFYNIAQYDLAISNWFNSDQYSINAILKQQLRYGENAHQKASLYANSNHGIVNAQQLQGKELSYNNLNDANCAYELVLEFTKPAVVIVKHANACGVCVSDNIFDAYLQAFNADSKSAFGGILAINQEIDERLAREIVGIFYEVIIAPKISESALVILQTKKNLRVLIADFKKDLTSQIKSISGGFLLQEQDLKTFNKNDLLQVSKNSVDDQEIEQLIFAMTVCKHQKSNAIVVANNFQTIGLGIGQTNRVDACEIACSKASQYLATKNNLPNLSADNYRNLMIKERVYLASDAFFPFADNIEIASKYGVRAIIAPKGSMRDSEVIAKADELGIALYFIETRHFKH